MNICFVMQIIFYQEAVQSVGAVEYADYISADRWGSIPGALGNVGYPFIAMFLCSLWSGMVVSVKVSSIGQIELLNHLTMCNVKLNC